MRCLTALLLAALASLAFAGNQKYEPLSASVKAGLHAAISDQAVPFLAFDTVDEARAWLDAMSKKIERRIPDRRAREEFLVTAHYEAKRAGLDPQLVLGLIQVESNFRKHAVSSAGARGYMQVMPFWIQLIGSTGPQSVQSAHQPALRLHHTASLPGHRARGLLPRTRALQRQPRPGRLSQHGGARVAKQLEVPGARRGRVALTRRAIMPGDFGAHS